MDYLRTLSELRQKVLSAPEQEAGLDRVVSLAERPRKESEGLFRRSKLNPKDLPQTPDPTKSLEDYILEMEQIRKTVKERTAGFRAAEAEGTKQAKITKRVDETLGVPQKPIREDSLSVREPQSKGEVVETIGAIANTIGAKMPADVKADKDFIIAANRIADKYQLDVNDLLAVISFESGFDPSVANQEGSGATGLIQFMPDTAKSLGTSTEELAKMSRAAQMKYVEKYLDQYGDRLRGGSAEDLYMAILWPAAIGKDKDYVLFQKDTIAYRQNKGLDLDGDGVITKAEAGRRALMHRRAIG